MITGTPYTPTIPGDSTYCCPNYSPTTGGAMYCPNAGGSGIDKCCTGADCAPQSNNGKTITGAAQDCCSEAPYSASICPLSTDPTGEDVCCVSKPGYGYSSYCVRMWNDPTQKQIVCCPPATPCGPGDLCQAPLWIPPGDMGPTVCCPFERIANSACCPEDRTIYHDVIAGIYYCK